MGKVFLFLFCFFILLILIYEYFSVPLHSKYKTLLFMLTDIEIAKSVKMRPINEVAAELGIHEDQVENYGRYIAKILRTRLTPTSLRITISSLLQLSALQRLVMVRPPCPWV